jgi:hypothetical protein
MTEHRKKMHMQMLVEKEKKWRSTYKNLLDQIKEQKMVVKKHRKELKTNPNARPIIFKRDIDTQTAITPMKVN